MAIEGPQDQRPDDDARGHRPSASDPAAVAEQAGLVAAAWSPRDAPASWHLTASQLAVLRDDRELLALAATIPPDRLPPLLFTAAANYLVLASEPEPLRSWFPRLGEPQAPLGEDFEPEYRSFLLDHREQLLELCAHHRYQMNEVGRCADVLPALAPAAEDGRPLALIDIGTGAGLGLHPDRYGYRFNGPGDAITTAGDRNSPVQLETQVRGARRPPLPQAPLQIAARVGIDIEPLDVGDAAVRSWLAACVPQEIGAVTRFHGAVEIATAHPARTVRGEAVSALAKVLAEVPGDLLVCVVDTFVHVFFPPSDQQRFRDLVAQAGAERDLDWVSIDPLVPMGRSGRDSVLGIPVPPALTQRNRDQGVFGLIGRLSYRGGRCSPALLGISHPGAAWIEWLAP